MRDRAEEDIQGFVTDDDSAFPLPHAVAQASGVFLSTVLVHNRKTANLDPRNEPP